MKVYEPPIVWIVSYEDLSDEEREFYDTLIKKKFDFKSAFDNLFNVKELTSDEDLI